MKKLSTICVQAGYKPENGEPRVTPIVQSTTFFYETPEEMGELFDLKKAGYFYTRLGNPTLGVLEEKITALEGGISSVATSSGMAASYMSILNLACSGDNILSLNTIYGGTYNQFKILLKRQGIECRYFNDNNTMEEIEKLIDINTKVIFVETLANAAMTVANFELLSKIAQKHGIVFMVDNTLATPVICRPLEHGANIVMHSTTKYLDGHATSVGGIVVDGGNFNYNNNPRYPLFNTPDESYHGLVFADLQAAFSIRFRVICMRDIGAQMAPMNAFLTNLGCETLHLRMPKHSSNALALAKALKNHPKVEWVNYAGLEGDKNYERVVKYFDNKQSSGMVTFGIKGGLQAASVFQRALKLFCIVTHIADARSCVLHPASTTHRQLSEKELLDSGIPSNLIRLSVGIEDEEDIIADILNALSKC